MDWLNYLDLQFYPAENFYPLALPRRVPHLELKSQRKESRAENHNRTVPLLPPQLQVSYMPTLQVGVLIQTLGQPPFCSLSPLVSQEPHPTGLPWTPAATAAAGCRPSVLVTGGPVVIVEESLVARVLGCGLENDPFKTVGRRTRLPAASSGSMFATLPYCHSTILPYHHLTQPSGIVAHSLQAVPNAEVLLPPLSRDMPVAMYDSLRRNSKDWYQLVPKEIKRPLGLDCDLPIITPLIEDETVEGDNSLPHVTSVKTADHIVDAVLESPPSGLQSSSTVESPSESPPSEEKPGDQSLLACNSQQDGGCVSTAEYQTQPQLQQKLPDTATATAEYQTQPQLHQKLPGTATATAEYQTQPQLQQKLPGTATATAEYQTQPQLHQKLPDTATATAEYQTQPQLQQKLPGTATATAEYQTQPQLHQKLPGTATATAEYQTQPQLQQKLPGTATATAEYQTQLDYQAQPMPDDVQRSSAHDCDSPQADETTCQERESVSESSQNSFGKRILKAWTDGIIAMAEGRAMPLPNVEKSSVANQSEDLIDAPYKERAAPVENLSAPTEAARSSLSRHLPLRPSMATLVCAEREEQVLQDSDSEIELEIPDMGSEQQASEQQQVLTGPITEEPPASKEPRVVIPQPPPPPQLGQPKASLHAPVPCPKVVAPESKFGELRLQNCFLNTESSTVSSGPLFSLGFTPLSPIKLTNSLRLGSSIATDELQKEISASGSEDRMANVRSEEPPVKKPRLLEMSDNEELLSPASENEGSSRAMRVLQESFPSNGITSPHEKQRTYDAEIAIDKKSSTNETAALHSVAVEQQETTPDHDVVQPEVVQVPAVPHPHGFTSLQSEYLHQPHEHADDGMDTVDQALPTESARQHTLVPNPAPCRKELEAENDDDDDDDSNDGGENRPGTVVIAEMEEEINRVSRHTVGVSVTSDEAAVIFPHFKTVQDEFCSQTAKPLTSPPQALLTVPAAELQVQSAPTKGDQQIVPESSFSTSLSVHSLYDEGDSSEKLGVAPSHGLEEEEEADPDRLDSPSLLAGALESMESKKKTLEHRVPQMSPVRQQSCFSNSRFSVVRPQTQGEQWLFQSPLVMLPSCYTFFSSSFCRS